MADSERSPAETRVPPTELPAAAKLLTLMVAVVVVASLYLARDVLVPITLAVLLTFVLAPLVRALRWLRLPRIPAVIISVVLALTVLLSVGGVIGGQIASLAQDLPHYENTIRNKLNKLRDMTVGQVTRLVERVEQFRPQESPPSPAPSEAGKPEQAPSGNGRDQLGFSSLLGMVQRFASPVLSPLATLGLVLVFTTFFLLQKEDLRDRFIRLFGAGDLHRTTVALNDAGRRLSKYFLAQIALNTAFGVIVATGLTLIGLPSPVLWGILAAFCRFVPYIGAWIAAALPLMVAAAVDPGWSMLLSAFGLFLVTEPVIGQVVEPLAYGHSTGLSPVSVLIATVFWTWLWGPIGLILATPLTLCLVVLGRHVDRLEFLDVLLGDRPALTATETFYQRMLAGNPDEVQDQAEKTLKTCPLSRYYDEVALRGLKLAADDALRGVLGASRLHHIRDGVCELVEELDDYDDTVAADEPGAATASGSGATLLAPAADTRIGAWRGSTPVLCIAGASPLDEAAVAMLVQLLGKHGIGARALASDRLSRARIAELERDDIALVCISLLQTTGHLARVRYLIRRLRRQLPTTPIMVGLWPREELPEGESVRATIVADLYVESLVDAVAACVDAAAAGDTATTAPAPARKAIPSVPKLAPREPRRPTAATQEAGPT